MEIKEGHQYYTKNGNITGGLIPSDYLEEGGWYDPRHGNCYRTNGRSSAFFPTEIDIVAEASEEAIRATRQNGGSPKSSVFLEYPPYGMISGGAVKVSLSVPFSETECSQEVKDRLLFSLAKMLDGENLLTTDTSSGKMTLTIMVIPPEEG